MHYLLLFLDWAYRSLFPLLIGDLGAGGCVVALVDPQFDGLVMRQSALGIVRSEYRGLYGWRCVNQRSLPLLLHLRRRRWHLIPYVLVRGQSPESPRYEHPPVVLLSL